MKRLCKSKSVSWAPDVNLCQVRLFLSEDAPLQSRFDIQDHLQTKSSWLLHSIGMSSDDQPPPGFEDPILNLPQIVLVKWKCPPKIVLDPGWGVVAGQESKEVEFQRQRELRVLEAVYPRFSSIPHSPSDSPDHIYHHNDFQTPVIPMTPIEGDDTDFDSASPIRTSNRSESQCLSKILLESGARNPSVPGSEVKSQSNEVDFMTSSTNDKPAIGAAPDAEPDVMAAASAAFTAIMRSNEKGSLIDRDLLIKILSNPEVLEKLVSENRTSSNLQTAPKPSSTPSPQHLSFPSLSNKMGSDAPLPMEPLSGQLNSVTKAILPSSNPSVANPSPLLASNALQNQIYSVTTVPMKASIAKDFNYCKTLILQHGEERNGAKHHATVQPSLLKPREIKSRFQKPCIFFNSPSGCRNGSSCLFQHDVAFSSFRRRTRIVPEVRDAKRIKLEQLTTGRS